MADEDLQQISYAYAEHLTYRSILAYSIGTIATVLWLIFYLSNPLPSALTTPEALRARPDAQLCNADDAYRYHLSNSSHAKCLDGSRPAFYWRKGTGDGKRKWIVYFEGGGWCFDLSACYLRSKTGLGSSMSYPRCLSRDAMQHFLSPHKEQNPFLYHWHAVHVRYCDGGSYAGYRTDPVLFAGRSLYFRGAVNRAETLRALLNMGMRNAEEVVIVGCSAGALGVYLGIDEMTRIIHEEGRSGIIVRALAHSGFFLDHASKQVVPNPTHDDAIINGVLDYGQGMRNVFHYMNMSAGANQACLEHASSVANGERHDSQAVDLSDCIFAANLARFLTTPVFTIQPQYDHWGVLHIVGRNYSAKSINHFGVKVSQQLQSGFLYNDSNHRNKGVKDLPRPNSHHHLNPGHGVYIDSCSHHCSRCSHPDENLWHGSRLVTDHERHTPAVAFQLWYAASLQSIGTAGNRSSLSIALPALFLQNHTYPCDTCCLCRM